MFWESEMLHIEIVERMQLLVMPRPERTTEVVSEAEWKDHLVLKTDYGGKAVTVLSGACRGLRLFLHFTWALQSKDQGPRLESHWNLRLQCVHWLVDFVAWSSAVINLTKLLLFSLWFSIQFIKLPWKTQLGLVHMWTERTPLLSWQAGRWEETES